MAPGLRLVWVSPGGLLGEEVADLVEELGVCDVDGDALGGQTAECLVGGHGGLVAVPDDAVGQAGFLVHVVSEQRLLACVRAVDVDVVVDELELVWEGEPLVEDGGHFSCFGVVSPGGGSLGGCLGALLGDELGVLGAGIDGAGAVVVCDCFEGLDAFLWAAVLPGLDRCAVAAAD